MLFNSGLVTVAVRTGATQQEVNVGGASRASPAAPCHPQCSHYPPSEPLPDLPTAAEKLSPMNLAPGTKEAGGCCFTALFSASHNTEPPINLNIKDDGINTLFLPYSPPHAMTQSNQESISNY